MYKNFVNVFTLGYIFRCITELVHTYPAIYNLLLHIWVFMYCVCIVIYIGRYVKTRAWYFFMYVLYHSFIAI